MRARLILHLGDDGAVTTIGYSLYDDDGQHLGTGTWTPLVEDSTPHAAYSDLLRRLGRIAPQMTANL